MAYTVYMHTTPSGKRYVGITCKSTRKRWNGGKGYPHNIYFNRAVNKYGWDNITHEVLATGLSEEEAIRQEKFFIALFRTLSPKYGYNQTTGGEVSKELSVDVRLRMSEAQRGEKSHNYGKRFSAETRKKMSVAMKGRTVSEETRRKLSEANKGKKNPFTDEHRQKIAASLKGKPKSAEHNRKNGEVHSRAVVNVETGERFDSIRSAARKYGVTDTAIGRNLRGQSKSACGYHWAYYTE